MINANGTISDIAISKESGNYIVGVIFELKKEDYIKLLEKSNDDRKIDLQI